MIPQLLLRHESWGAGRHVFPIATDEDISERFQNRDGCEAAAGEMERESPSTPPTEMKRDDRPEIRLECDVADEIPVAGGKFVDEALALCVLAGQRAEVERVFLGVEIHHSFREGRFEDEVVDPLRLDPTGLVVVEKGRDIAHVVVFFRF